MKTEKAIIIAYTTEDQGYPVVVEFIESDPSYEYEDDGFHYRTINNVEIVNINKLDREYSALKDDIRSGLELLLNTSRLNIIY